MCETIPPPFLRHRLKCKCACLDNQTSYRMVCPVYFHLFLPGNTGLYICTCVLWRVGCADITASLCDLILVTGWFFVHLETRIKINIWFNLPVHVLFFTLPSFLWHILTEEQCWRSAMHAPHNSSSKREKENMRFSVYRDNPAIRHKRSVLDFWIQTEQVIQSQWGTSASES